MKDETKTTSYAIRTGLEMTDLRGVRLEVLTCTEDGGASWLEDAGAERVTRGDYRHSGQEHDVVSLSDALLQGLVDAQEGAILLAPDQIIGTLLKRAEAARSGRIRTRPPRVRAFSKRAS